MNFIDLHVHSTASDGTLTPYEVVKTAKEQNLYALALTDHDTVAGIPEALSAAQKFDITVIPGIEITCHALGKEIHMLGFFLNYKDPLLLQRLESLRQNRASRNEQMLAAFQRDGFPITMEKLKHGNPDTVITRAHFARVLVEEGIVPSKDAAFQKYLGDGKKYYIPRSRIKPEDAIRYIRDAGGIAVLAHPYEYHLSNTQLVSLMKDLKKIGLQGIEVYHSNNYQQQSNYLRSLTHELDLAATGGSDFHGLNKPDIQLGTGRGGLKVHKSLLDELVKYRYSKK
ncbi:MAG: PHP domain-containing protein [Lachnospiraceae bacterium]|nr:PHP domain-containing protein [Lachnospiraceae bacterium]